jgi:hypothetical protein
MFCRDADDFSDIGRVVKMIEQRLQLLRWGDPNIIPASKTKNQNILLL